MPKAAKCARHHYIFKESRNFIGSNLARMLQHESEMPASPCNPLARSDQSTRDAGHSALSRVCRAVLMKVDMKRQVKAPLYWSSDVGFLFDGNHYFVVSKENGEPSSEFAVIANQKSSVVILQPEVRNQILAHNVTQRIFQLHRLNKQIVLRIQPLRRHRRLEVKAQPLLNS